MEIYYTPSTSQYGLYPMRLILADLYVEGLEQPLRMINNFKCEWGDATAVEEFCGKPTPRPVLLVLRWWSPYEQKFYNAVRRIDSKCVEQLWKIQEEKKSTLDKFTHIVAGTAPYGGTAIWLRGYTKSVLLDWMEAESIPLSERNFAKLSSIGPKPQDIQLPPKELFISWMRQYRYRYITLEEYWDGETWQNYDCEDLVYDDLDLQNIRDKRTDGTFDITGDMSLLTYHEAGCPSRFSLYWNDGRNNVEAHFWMDDDAIASIFKDFQDSHPNTEIDFLVRIDKRANQYELALIDKDRMTPQFVIPQDTYQVLIFNNDIEYYKSDNYNQDEGAWYW